MSLAVLRSGHRVLAVPFLAAPLLAAVAMTGCSGGDGPESPGTDGLRVVAGFYPLQYAAERVAGDLASVDSLTKPGGEPHDLELTPRDVAAVSDADLVVYLAGFQPAVDDAAASQARGRAFDVTPAARLAADEDPSPEDGQAEGERAGSGHADDGNSHGSRDPHFWLDPTRLADVGDALATRLAELDPADAATYTANAGRLRADLETLDGEWRTGLASCESRDLITGHEAFGYLAERYHLRQQGIAGLSPDAEPDAAALARIAEYVRAHGVHTVYTETLTSPAVAETVARETGARTAVLDPVEGLSEASAAPDYLGVMRANLATLRAGQSCS